MAELVKDNRVKVITDKANGMFLDLEGTVSDFEDGIVKVKVRKDNGIEFTLQLEESDIEVI